MIDHVHYCSKIVTNDSHHVPNENLQFLCITTLTLQRGRYKTQVTGHRSQGTGHRAQVTGYRLQGTGHRAQVTENAVKIVKTLH